MRLIRTQARSTSSPADRASGEFARVRPRDLVLQWARRRRVRRGFALRARAASALAAPATPTLEARAPTSSRTALRPDVAPLPWRETHASWFACAPRPSWSFAVEDHDTFSDLVPAPMVVVRRAGEPSPGRAGALAGTIGAALANGAMLAGATSASVRDAVARLGVLLSAHRLAGPAAASVAVGFVLALGAVLGLGFGALARRLRKLAPLVVVSVVLSVATGLLARGVLCVRYAPSLAGALPIRVSLLAAAIFGLALALELPIRERAAAPSRSGEAVHDPSRATPR